MMQRKRDMVNKSNVPSRPIIKKELLETSLKPIQVKTESCAGDQKVVQGSNDLNEADIKKKSSAQCTDEPTSFFSNFKDGQKVPSPPVGDGTRAFYESLLKEKSDSIMATKYCIENGILVGTQRKQVYQYYCILKELGAFKKIGGVKTEIQAEAKKTFEKLYKETKTPLQPSSDKPLLTKVTPKKRMTSTIKSID